MHPSGREGPYTRICLPVEGKTPWAGKWRTEGVKYSAAEGPRTSPGYRVERMNPPGSGGLRVPRLVWLLAGHRDTLPGLIFLSCTRDGGRGGPHPGVKGSPGKLSPWAWPTSDRGRASRRAQVTRVGRKRGPSPMLRPDLSVPVGPLEALCEETAVVAVKVCKESSV